MHKIIIRCPQMIVYSINGTEIVLAMVLKSLSRSGLVLTIQECVE